MLTDSAAREYLARMNSSMREACAIAKRYDLETLSITDKGGRDLITEVDLAINDVLRNKLPRRNEGWLSEEDTDNTDRLSKEVVWVVDPLDGTREFVDGVPEWCISIGLAMDGVAVAGAICNPATDQLFLGSLVSGVIYNGRPTRASLKTTLEGALILASRQEYKRGDWAVFEGRGFSVQPMGSVAYKLALVSAGLADATWTLSPKHEWDVAAGVALVNSAGGYVKCTRRAELLFNKSDVVLPGLVASGNGIAKLVQGVVDEAPST